MQLWWSKSRPACWCFPISFIALHKRQVICIPSGNGGRRGSECRGGKLGSGVQELNHSCAHAIWASLYHETSSLTIHVETMRSCVLMCAASLCRTGDAQIYLLELAWRRLAWIPMQCSSISEYFGFLCIDDCVSLYYTTPASCEMFRLAENRLAKKRNGCTGLCRPTKRTSLSYASDSCGNAPELFGGRSYNHGHWMLCC